MRRLVLSLQLLLATALFEQSVSAAPGSEQRYDQQKTDTEAYFERLSRSSHATERALHLVHIAPHTNPREFAELSRQWQQSKPNPQAIQILASTMCTHGRLAACDDALFARWSQQEPNNAFIWSIAASRAQYRGLAEQVEVELQRVMTSQRFDTGFWAVFDALRESLRRDAEFSQRSTRTQALAALDMAEAIATPLYNDVLHLCPSRRMIDAQRIPLCLHLARLMLDHTSDRLSARIGYQILGSPAMTQDQNADANRRWEHWRMLIAQIAVDRRLHADPAVETHKDLDRYLGQVIADGQMQAMTDWLAETAALDARMAETSTR